MAFERFTREARTVVTEARHGAAAAGTATVEPTHVLTALAADTATPAGRALAAVGLDPAEVEAAIERDDRALLAAVGVKVDDAARDTTSVMTRPRFSAATKRLLEQSLHLALTRGDRHIGSEHILLATLRSDAGRIPQVLEAAGTSPEEIEHALEC